MLSADFLLAVLSKDAVDTTVPGEDESRNEFLDEPLCFDAEKISEASTEGPKGRRLPEAPSATV